jgi:hypothetical protein
VVHGAHELRLLLELGERLRVAPLQRRRVAEPHVRADDHHAGAPRDEGLLQLDRAARGGLGLREVARQRRAVRELERAPAGARVERERALVGRHGAREVAAQDEVHAPDT